MADDVSWWTQVLTSTTDGYQSHWYSSVSIHIIPHYNLPDVVEQCFEVAIFVVYFGLSLKKIFLFFESGLRTNEFRTYVDFLWFSRRRAAKFARTYSAHHLHLPLPPHRTLCPYACLKLLCAWCKSSPHQNMALTSNSENYSENWANLWQRIGQRNHSKCW